MNRLIGAALALALACGAAWGQAPGIPIGGGGGPGSQVLPSAGTVGDLVVVGPLTQGVQDASALSTTYATMPKGINLTGNPVVATSIGPSTSEIYWNGTYSGICTSVAGCFANSLIMSSTVDASASSNGLGNLQVQTTLNSSSVKGSIANFQSNLHFNATSGNSTNQFYVSSNIWADTSANDGGTGSGGNARGSIFAINPQTLCLSGATNWVECSIDEHNITLATGASANLVYGMKVILASTNAVAATTDSAGFLLGIQAGGTNTLACGYCLGQNGGDHGIASTGAAFGSTSSGLSTIRFALDLSKIPTSVATILGPSSQDTVIQAGTTGGARNVVLNSGGNGATTVVAGAVATITSRFNITPGTGIGGATTIGSSGTGTGGLIINSQAGIFIEPTSAPVIVSTSLEVGSTSAATLSTGEFALAKISASGTAPTAGFLKMEATAGTAGGSCKIIAYAGTSTTPVTLVDNVGTGC